MLDGVLDLMLCVCGWLGMGRVDAKGPSDCAVDGLLPAAHGSADDLRRVFYRMGFNDGEIVALAGILVCRRLFWQS